MLEKELKEVQQAADESLFSLQATIKDLLESKKLDFHRDDERKAFMDVRNRDSETHGAPGPLADSEKRAPLKSKMTNKAQRLDELKQAVARYISRRLGDQQVTNTGQGVCDVSIGSTDSVDIMYESDYNDDLM
ncbi:hypothetical protein CPC08DRAFT_823148 [Agrocybe pediades]|nr:hypothetical protein CPC08DRAFT_823148 [Agrocybe pediades]